MVYSDGYACSKKGNKLDPANYRAISLSSVPVKVSSHILLQRIEPHNKSFLHDNQFGLRVKRGTTDAIFIVRQIIEKAKEHKVNLDFNFIDFNSVFAGIWRKALWKMLRYIGASKKIVNILEELYKKTECTVITGGKLTEWFDVLVGGRKSCLISPTLFNIFLEFAVLAVKRLSTEFQLDETRLAMDIKHADDTTLLYAIFKKIIIATEELQSACNKQGMKINFAKCEVLNPSADQ